MVHEFRVIVAVDRRLARALLAAGLIAVVPIKLGSETLTLTATYPTPSGSYKRIITTGSNPVCADNCNNTLLNRDGGDTYLAPGGKVGIGTTSPTRKLTVNGDVRIAGNAAIASGLPPDFDSGWIGDGVSTDHETFFAHPLGVIPRRMMAFFSPTDPPTVVYPVAWSWNYPDSGNPVNIALSATQVKLSIYNNAGVFRGVWSPATGWTHYPFGYWKVLLWK